MMKFRIMSDLHLDYCYIAGGINLPELDDDASTILLVPGDICEGNNTALLIEFLTMMSNRFKEVIFILGNHDYYMTDMLTHVQRIKELAENFYNVTFLHRSVIPKEFPDTNTVIIGSTLWTDFNNEDVIAYVDASRYMSDYTCIRYDGKPLGSHNILDEHHADLKYIKYQLKQYEGWNTIVITHHAPSPLSITERYKGDFTNAYFISDIHDIIDEYKPNVWIHGHVHSFHDYLIDSTRVICNPVGYRHHIYGNENTGYNNTYCLNLTKKF